MTDKAEAVLRKIRQRQALKQWKRLNNPDRRDRILNDFNRDQMDDLGPIGGQHGMKLLSEITLCWTTTINF